MSESIFIVHLILLFPLKLQIQAVHEKLKINLQPPIIVYNLCLYQKKKKMAYYCPPVTWQRKMAYYCLSVPLPRKTACRRACSSTSLPSASRSLLNRSWVSGEVRLFFLSGVVGDELLPFVPAYSIYSKESSRLLGLHKRSIMMWSLFICVVL